jgi:hypothetical protein
MASLETMFPAEDVMSPVLVMVPLDVDIFPLDVDIFPLVNVTFPPLDKATVAGNVQVPVFLLIMVDVNRDPASLWLPI